MANSSVAGINFLAQNVRPFRTKPDLSAKPDSNEGSPFRTKLKKRPKFDTWARTWYEDLLAIVKRRKLKWFGHVSHLSGLAKTILQGHTTLKRGRRQGRQKKRRKKKEVGRQRQGMDRPGVRQVPEGSGEQGKMEETGCEVGVPTTSAVKG